MRAVKILVSIVVVLAIIFGCGEWAFRSYISSHIKEIYAESGGDVSVSLGARPLLFSLIDQRIPELTIETPGSRITVRDMELTGEQTIGEMDVSTDISNADILAQLQSALSTALNESDDASADATETTDSAEQEIRSLVSGLVSHVVSISDFTSDAEAGTVTLEFTGGLAALTLYPRVSDDGELHFVAEDASLLGIGMPEDIVDSITQALDQETSTVANGLRITRCTVMDDGLHIELSGTDVRLGDYRS